MAIPATPSNFYVQTANGQNYLSWDLTTGATSYSVQRSTDGITFTTLASPAVAEYPDTAVTLGTRYYYKVAAVNISGTSPYTAPQMGIPTPTGELSLSALRQFSQMKADRVNSNFVTLPEWNKFINLACNELYDLLITAYEDYFIAAPAKFVADGVTYSYPLPNGSRNFLDQNNNSFVAKSFYKLLGVDLALNTAVNAWVTVNKFTFMDRNRFVFPNTASTIYGVFNLQYRILGDNIQFIPTPSSGQAIRLWYIPRLDELIKDNDITTLGFSGWLQYVIVRAAKYALDKEESDTSKLDMEIAFLKQRIEESAVNRDAGQPDRITDVRQNGWWGANSGGYGWNGPMGGL